jgi:hypothetical protein
MCLGFGSLAQSATLEDMFANRQTVTNTSGQINGDNTGATLEPGEPKHAGKTGGHSLWVSWVAPTNGVATFQTAGSGFDTLLAAYHFNSTNDTAFSALQVVSAEDDSEGFERESGIQFGALAGEHYEIAVDGYFGAVGPVELNWEFVATTSAPPVIVATPADLSARLGDPVLLSVTLTNPGSARFQWYFNGSEQIPSVTTTNLLISSLQVTNVGRYKLRVTVDGVDYFLPPTEVQINTDGATNTLARGKLLDSPGTPLIGSDGSGAARLSGRFRPLGGGITGVARGYNGSQIFNTTYATVDTNEPPHCGVSNGVSYWLIYQPPTNGTITLDTLGSSYDTVMEVYTYNGALAGYQDLISIACDHNSAATNSAATNGASRVQFAVVKSRPYVVAVEGVNGARGTAWLNYSLNTNQLPVAPALLAPPAAVVVPQGASAWLAASLTGAPPLRFSWAKNTTPLSGVTTPAIYFPSTVTNDTANYVVTVTNDLGSLSATLPLRVLVAPSCTLTQFSGWLQLSFPTVSGQRYTVEEAGAVIGPWQGWPNFYFGDNQPVFLNVTNGGTKFYRVRVQ